MQIHGTGIIYPPAPISDSFQDMLMKMTAQKSPILAAAVLLAGLYSSPRLARADNNGAACDRASQQVEHTRALIARAEDRLRGCASDRPRILLKTASDLNDAASRQVLEGHCKFALQLSDKAAQQALELERVQCSGVDGAMGDLQPSFVEGQLDRTEEILSRVTSEVKEGGDDRTQRIIDDAVQMQRRARELFTQSVSAGGDKRAENLRHRSLELTFAARDRALKAESLAPRSTGNTNPDRVAEELRKTDELVATALEFSESGAAEGTQGRVEMARDLESQARRFYDQREFTEAIRLTLRARDMLRSALGGAASASLGELDRAIQHAESVLEQARAAKLSPTGAGCLSQAEVLLGRAQQQRQNGRPRLALLNAEAARLMAQRALNSPAP
jgi:tetratricopeptide (TPR) repeat protein